MIDHLFHNDHNEWALVLTLLPWFNVRQVISFMLEE